MMKSCPSCGNEYKSIGKHFSRSSDCSHPTIESGQMEMLKGILMGDGTISTINKNPYMRIEMINGEYLRNLANENPLLFGEVRTKFTAEESAEQNRQSGWQPEAKSENYSDIYVVQTFSHPELKELADWYSTGKKVFPESIQLTPTMLKHWYCCDGNLSDYGNFRIGCSNEISNKEKLKAYFSPLDVEVLFGEYQIWFHKEDSLKLYEYMGEPPDGFKYKWPKPYR